MYIYIYIYIIYTILLIAYIPVAIVYICRPDIAGTHFESLSTSIQVLPAASAAYAAAAAGIGNYPDSMGLRYDPRGSHGIVIVCGKLKLNFERFSNLTNTVYNNS
jgi:hypothetical protein